MPKKNAVKVAPKKGRITKDMSLGSLAESHPGAMQVLYKYGFHCIGCGMAAFETIEQGALAHGMDAKSIDKMVKEMNSAHEE